MGPFDGLPRSLLMKCHTRLGWAPESGPVGWLRATAGPVRVVWAHSRASVGAKNHRSAHWGGLRACPVSTFGAAAAWGPRWSKGTSEAPKGEGAGHGMSARAGMVLARASAGRCGTTVVWGHRGPQGGTGHRPMSAPSARHVFSLQMNLLAQVKGEPVGEHLHQGSATPLLWYPATRDPAMGA